jgi:serine/arginine repetitive matrix protein 2
LSAPPASFKDGVTSPRRSPRRDSGRFEKDNSMIYEDSFSEIPEAVLEAATPRRPMAKAAQEEQIRSSPLAAYTSNGSATNLQSEPGRLLTPEETPSPTDSQGNSNMRKKGLDTDSVMEDEVSLIIHPSLDGRQTFLQPPEGTHISNASEKVTPINARSSPAMLPLAHALVPALDAEGKGHRPPLSPIIRAGQALQSVTSDNSSPVARQRTLGSPFRRSGSNISNSAKSDKSWTLLEEDMSQPRASLFQQQPQDAGTPVIQDPFTEETQTSGQPSFVRALAQSVFSTVAKSIPVFRSSVSSPAPKVIHEELDEMSWMPDSPSKTALDGGANSEEPRGLTSDEPPASQPMVQLSVGQDQHAELGLNRATDEPNGDDGDHEGDEEDIWAVEAQRPTPRSKRQQPFGKQTAGLAGRRGKLPSPWTRKAGVAKKAVVPPHRQSPYKRAMARDEESQIDEYSMLSQAKASHVPHKDIELKPQATNLHRPHFQERRQQTKLESLCGEVSFSRNKRGMRSLFNPTWATPCFLQSLRSSSSRAPSESLFGARRAAFQP